MSIIKLDLMQTDRSFLDDLVAFLAPRAGSRRVMISSRDQSALLYLHTPPARRHPCCSVWPGPMRSTSCSRTPRLQRAIGGVSVFQGLVDMNLVTWVHQHKLLILAWTVNDSQRFNQLVRLGVDGITTANPGHPRALEKEPWVDQPSRLVRTGMGSVGGAAVSHNEHWRASGRSPGVGCEQARDDHHGPGGRCEGTVCTTAPARSPGKPSLTPVRSSPPT